MTLQEEVTLSIINNIGIGAVVGFGAFLLNIVLERYKTSQALREEGAKLRIRKIAEIWDGLEDIHGKLIKIGLEIIDIKYRDKVANETTDSISEEAINLLETKIAPEISTVADEVIPDMRYKIQAYRFWLGKNLTEVHIQQLNALSQLTELYGKDLTTGRMDLSREELYRATSLIESTKKDIVQIMKYF